MTKNKRNIVIIGILMGVLSAPIAGIFREPSPEPVLQEVIYDEAPTVTVVELKCTNVNKEQEEMPTKVDRVYYDCPFDKATQDLIYDNMEAMSIDIGLNYILALVFRESGFRQYAESCSGSKGYMQMVDNTFNFAYTACIEEFPQFEGLPYDVFNKNTNLTIGMWYMHCIADSCDYDKITEDNIDRILCSYNRGVRGANNYYIDNGTYVSSYCTRIFDTAQQIKLNNGIVVYQ